MTTPATPVHEPGTPITTPDTPPLSPVKQTIADLRAAEKAGELDPRIGTRATTGGVEPQAPATEPTDKIVELPPLTPDGEPVRLALDDAETASLLRTYVNAGANATEIAAAQQEVEDTLLLMETDPVGVIRDRMTPERRAEVAKVLMAYPDVREAVMNDERDPSQVLLEAEQQRAAGIKRVQVRAYARDVHAVIARMCEGLDQEAATGLYNDLVRDAAELVKANRDQPFALADAPQLFANRLSLYGVDPADAAARLARGGLSPSRGNARSDDAAAIAAARDTGKKFTAGRAARREFSAVPGAGAGARPAKVEMPAQQGVKERIAELRKRFL
jgi:hypothetical protein